MVDVHSGTSLGMPSSYKRLPPSHTSPCPARRWWTCTAARRFMRSRRDTLAASHAAATATRLVSFTRAATMGSCWCGLRTSCCMQTRTLRPLWTARMDSCWCGRRTSCCVRTRTPRSPWVTKLTRQAYPRGPLPVTLTLSK
eukprot:363402-Chlamydomonas_euryale.AAC.8